MKKLVLGIILAAFALTFVTYCQAETRELPCGINGLIEFIVAEGWVEDDGMVIKAKVENTTCTDVVSFVYNPTKHFFKIEVFCTVKGILTLLYDIEENRFWLIPTGSIVPEEDACGRIWYIARIASERGEWVRKIPKEEI